MLYTRIYSRYFNQLNARNEEHGQITMMIDKVIKWHETKDIALANEICEDLYELYTEMYNNGIFKEEEYDETTEK